MVLQDGSCSSNTDVQLFAVCIHDIFAATLHVEILEVNVYHLHAHSKASKYPEQRLGFIQLLIWQHDKSSRHPFILK